MKMKIIIGTWIACICGVFNLVMVSCSAREEPSAVFSPSTIPAKEDFYEKALLQYRSQSFEEALVTLDKAIAAGSETAEIYNLRGMTLQQLERPDAALDDFSRAISINPLHAESLNNRGFAHQLRGEEAEAEADFVKAIEADPSLAQAHYNMGFLLYIRGEYSRAIEYLTQATELNPEDSDAWLQLGLAYGRANQPEQATVAYTRVIEIEQGFDDQAYFLRGIALADQAAFAEAEADFDKAVSRGLRNADTLFYRGLMRYHLDRLDEALSDFTETISYEPRHTEAYYYRSFIQARLGNQDEARADAQKALELDPPADTVLLP